jgi:hypothetical protein
LRLNNKQNKSAATTIKKELMATKWTAALVSYILQREKEAFLFFAIVKNSSRTLRSSSFFTHAEIKIGSNSSS